MRCRREWKEVDVAAEYEAGKERSFVYEGYDTTCLVDLDDLRLV